MKKIILSSMVLFALVSCSSSSNKTGEQDTANDSVNIVDDHNAQVSLDYYGVYEGVTPCADCEGIKVNLTLNKDSSFVIKSVYLKNGEELLPTESTGKFVWDSQGRIITLEGVVDQPSHFSVQEGGIMMLDMEGKEIDSVLKDHYYLKQIEVY